MLEFYPMNGQRILLGRLSIIEFLNGTPKNYIHTRYNILQQHAKVVEEFKEFHNEKIGSDEYIGELLDLIQASINLYHMIENDYKCYNRHVKKMNDRLKNGYDWGYLNVTGD